MSGWYFFTTVDVYAVFVVAFTPAVNGAVIVSWPPTRARASSVSRAHILSRPRSRPATALWRVPSPSRARARRCASGPLRGISRPESGRA